EQWGVCLGDSGRAGAFDDRAIGIDRPLRGRGKGGGPLDVRSHSAGASARSLQFSRADTEAGFWMESVHLGAISPPTTVCSVLVCAPADPGDSRGVVSAIHGPA